MATDAEESDTDARPAKRMRLGGTDIRMDVRSIEPQEVAGDAESLEEHNEMERLARERLKKWQACQVAKGFVDNTINCVLENHVVMQSFEDVHSREISHVNEMEDHAVTMAILNHGLVQATNVISSSGCQTMHDRHGVNSFWTNNEQDRCECANITEHKELDKPGPAVPSNSLFASRKLEENHSCWISEKTDENNQQQDFLERAVAEAIKKKGLSALSVDYG